MTGKCFQIRDPKSQIRNCTILSVLLDFRYSPQSESAQLVSLYFFFRST